VIEQLRPYFPSISAEQIKESQLDGFYEVVITNPRLDVLFISYDGLYVIQGDVINLVTKSNLTVNKINILRKEIIDTIAEKDKIVFKANNERYIIHVFTDVDCPYCAKLHADMSKMNALGITVKYLASPLEQLHPQAQSSMEKIWCAEDKNQAIHNYKIQRILPKSAECENPVAQQLAISKQLGVNGTPSIFFEDGTNMPGYQEPEILLQNIEQASSQ
jgi:thiol:disulfide interchange protein DsbC